MLIKLLKLLSNNKNEMR